MVAIRGFAAQKMPDKEESATSLVMGDLEEGGEEGGSAVDEQLRCGQDRELEPGELAQVIAEAGGAVGKHAHDLAVVLFSYGVDTLYAAAELSRQDVIGAVEDAVGGEEEMSLKSITSINAGKVVSALHRMEEVKFARVALGYESIRVGDRRRWDMVNGEEEGEMKKENRTW